MRVRTVVGTSIASICGLALAVAPSAGAGASTASNQAAATKSVTAAFTTLFNAKDKNKAAKEALLEDPSKYKGGLHQALRQQGRQGQPDQRPGDERDLPDRCGVRVRRLRVEMCRRDLQPGLGEDRSQPAPERVGVRHRRQRPLAGLGHDVLRSGQARRGCLLIHVAGRIRRPCAVRQPHKTARTSAHPAPSYVSLPLDRAMHSPPEPSTCPSPWPREGPIGVRPAETGKPLTWPPVLELPPIMFIMLSYSGNWPGR